MQAGIFTLDLYCEADGDTGHRYGIGQTGKVNYHKEFLANKDVDGFGQFCGETRWECMQAARKFGWVIGKKILCPWCAGNRKRIG